MIKREPDQREPYHITIDRGLISRRLTGRLSPLRQYIMAHVVRRHHKNPERVSDYRKVIDDPGSDPLPEALIAAAEKTTEDTAAETVWMESVLRRLVKIADLSELWLLNENAMEADSMRLHPDKTPMAVRERRVIKALAAMNIEADFSGEYPHEDGDCPEDGYCCLKMKDTEIPDDTSLCLPGSDHFFVQAEGVSYFMGKALRSLGITETCLRCGSRRQSSSSPHMDERSTEFLPSRVPVPVGVPVGPVIYITGAPGVPMDADDPPAVFDAVVNDVFSERAILTLDGRDVSDLTCERCERWTGSSTDPEIAHLSTDHTGGCPPPISANEEGQ